MSYVLHVDFADFVDQLFQCDQPTVVYLQDLLRTASDGGISSTITSQLLLTAQDDRSIVHAARIVARQASLLMGDQKALRATVRDRAATAHDLVIDALPDTLTLAHGILSVPGLLADVQSVQTEHDLWQWERATDAQTRRIVPTARPHTARAAFTQAQHALTRIDAAACERLDDTALTWLIERAEDIRSWVVAERQRRFRALANDGQ